MYPSDRAKILFDLNLLPLKLAGGLEQTEIPGLLIASPPRRRERSRAGDVLIVLFSLPGELLTAATRLELQERLVAGYYRTRGPVTTGLRVAIDELNHSLLRRNLRTREGAIQGLLNVAVLRRDVLTLAHAGPTQSFLLHENEVQCFNDPESSGMGLGVSRTFGLRFKQARIQAGDLLVLSASPPTGWKGDSLRGAALLPPEQARARLLALAGENVEAAALLFQAGTGQVNRLGSSPAAAPAVSQPIESAAPAADPQPAEAAPLAATEPEAPAKERPAVSAEPAGAPTPAPVEAVYLGGAPGESRQPARIPVAAPPRPGAQPAGPSARKRLPAVPPPSFDLRRSLAKIWRAGRRTGRRINRSGKAFAGRLLPAHATQSQGLPHGLMVFIAIAVPIAVVAAAATMYLFAPSGRSEQQKAYLDQAAQYAAQAEQEDNQVLKRNNWSQALHWLDEADRYGKSDEAIALRKQARASLDALDGILRLALQPAVAGGFTSNMQFTRMAASSTDVYLLDAGQGRVVRMFLTGIGYEVDGRFQCGPGPVDNAQAGAPSVPVGALIDIALLPPNNNYQATLMAIDGNGNLLYCKPGGTPKAAALPAPEPAWGTITHMFTDQGLLYVLDKQNNRIWIYVGTDYKFEAAPRLYFDNDVPVLSDVVDIAVNGEDMYILHDNGQMTTCVFRSFASDLTRCSEKVPFIDQRPGHEAAEVAFPDARFTAMQITRPPDSSLYILDANGPSVYHFSLRLNLRDQYRPDPDESYALPGTLPATFAITSSRVALIAYDYQVFYGGIP